MKDLSLWMRHSGKRLPVQNIKLVYYIGTITVNCFKTQQYEFEKNMG